MKLCTLLLFSKSSTFNLNRKTNMPIHCVILCKEIFNILFTNFYISIRESIDRIKRSLHFLVKIYMLGDPAVF